MNYVRARRSIRQEMGETEHITVAETSDGPGGSRPAGEEISLPVVELLTGRGFVTGKSGSGKSNSASVIAERLLDGGFGLFIVDVDGEYYGLKEEYEILHVGADEECDIQVTTEHAEKLAGLALEQNVPIILDVSSYLDEAEAEALLTAVARSLFAKAKKQKQPFLLLVEEIHEYIPEQGSVGECGQMLIKIGKRGRKHGLGLCGISQRPADVKKDFITQCDWLLWHRLTWQNDTRVVRRILDGEYADAVEDLDDGEGFLVTDWTDDVRRVQFYRKETFDAGATPGLEDVERPDLKSVSEDLVSELEAISDEASEREDRIAELEAELEQKEARIEELERELRDARDLQDLAEQFVGALGDHPTAATGDAVAGDARAEDTGAGETHTAVGDALSGDAGAGNTHTPVGAATGENAGSESAPDGPWAGEGQPDWPGGWRASEDDTATADGAAAVATGEAAPADSATGGSRAGADTPDDPEPFSAERILSRLRDAPGPGGGHLRGRTAREEIELELYSDVEVIDDETAREGGGDTTAADARSATVDTDTAIGPSDAETDDEGSDVDATMPEEEKRADNEESDTDATVTEEGGTDDGDSDVEAMMPEEEPLVVRELKADIGGLETKTRRMLAFYREQGPASAQNAHFAAGGDGDRTQAYARNRTLRTRGLIDHVGRGRYDYRLRERLAEELGDHVDSAVVDAYAREIEETTLDV